MKKLLWIVCIALLATGAFAAEAEQPQESADLGTCPVTVEQNFTPLDEGVQGKGQGGKPGGNACCDPALQPGTNGNPFCFEGATCCDNGSWSCNNPDGSPSCTQGEVCDGSCGTSGASCTTGSDCCSGQCKGNGSCK